MSQRADYVVSAMLEEGLVSREQIESCTAHAREHNIPLDEAMVALDVVSRRQLATMLAEISECQFVDLEAYEINFNNTRVLPYASAQRLCAFPLFDLGDTITVGLVDPLDLAAVDQLRRLLKAEIEPVLCERGALEDLIARAYSMSAGSIEAQTPGETESTSLVTGDEPMVAAVDQILSLAAREGTSDIHIAPDEQELHLRFRIDGGLQKRHGPPKSGHAGLVQRLKVMASLDLTQTRRPQDGKFRFTHAGSPVDVRVSIIPTIYGESVVLRLLTSGTSIKDLADLGISPSTVESMETALDSSHGMFLVTGPTGSGKTTTLYTALKRLNTPDRNLMTIEDPVEIRLPMVRQLQVNSEIGLTFAGALRSILRQDPDVVLVGEIRDEETARTACQAALTGHLVLSTLHTNDAPGAVGRLRDMGCPPFAINAALIGSLAQRLLRRVCPECVEPAPRDALLFRRFGLADDHAGLVRGAGCGKCMSSGFRGRLTVTELFHTSRETQMLVESGASAAAIRTAAIQGGMTPMWRDGLDKAMMGFTTLEEVGRSVAIAPAETDTRSSTPELAA